MDERSVFKKATPAEIPNLFIDHLKPLFLHHILFGYDDDTLRDTQETADFKMLAGLRHDTFVGGDDEGKDIHPGNSGDHVFDKLFMAGHIDDAETVTARKIKIGKAEFNGYAPFLLFLEPVGIYIGEGSDKTGFTMIDMTSCS
jgi:hypothetical protein